MSSKFLKMLAIAPAMLAMAVANANAQNTGAVYTTDNTCSGVDLNIFPNKDAVYLDGGPTNSNAKSGLPDGLYFVQVTEPNGTLLGKPVDCNTPQVTVVDGKFVTCYQLSAILTKASDSTPGYDTTTNAGGEYKVWVSQDCTFTNSETKTDNFKVNTVDCPEPPCVVTPQGLLVVQKFYDANANGQLDNGEVLLQGWKVNIQDGINIDRYTDVNIIVAPDTYTVSEYASVVGNWFATTATSFDVPVVDGGTSNVLFGNLCLGGGGGLTLGFWSNKNGQALFGADDLALMVSLNLRDSSGANFDPASYTSFRAWILGATATNMANMLSAQLAAMELNVLNGKVSGGSLVYAPGSTSANALGFATISNLMAEANSELGLHGLVLDGSPYRAYQEALKNALDKANNNLNFVQAGPCDFGF